MIICLLPLSIASSTFYPMILRAEYKAGPNCGTLKVGNSP